MSEQLLPCPFCGERLERSEALSTRTFDTLVHPLPEVMSSEMCLFVGSIQLRSNNEPRIAAWNRRAQAQQPGALEAFDALDIADRLIERAYGVDEQTEWTEAYAAVARARAEPSKGESQ